MNLSTEPFRLIFISADPTDAALVARAGVDLVMVDLETIGKQARQGHLDTLISEHAMDDIADVAAAVAGTRARVMVRLNPLHKGTRSEVDLAIANGAQRLMLPMFRHPDEVVAFLEIVDERVPVTLLLETASALARLPQIIALPGDFDLHIGLNDLHLELRLDFMFELFSGGIMAHVAMLCNTVGRSYGIGGVARIGAASALRPELIIDAHQRLGSSGVILSRDWRNGLKDGSFANSVAELRAYLSLPPGSSQAEMDAIVAEVARVHKKSKTKN